MDIVSPPIPLTTSSQIRAADLSKLRDAVTELEASFLAEMLKSAGLGEAKGEFSGGTGETQFASFLRLEQAREIARTGGIGLAEQVFESLKGRLHDE